MHARGDAQGEPEVLAAGGLVFDGARVAVVHRPRYDDWSLPKGKLDRDESFEQAAIREVEEETGMRGRLGRPLGSTSYRDRKGRLKLVRYFLITAPEGEFVPNEEVDELRWLTPPEALELLSYEYDRELVASR